MKKRVIACFAAALLMTGNAGFVVSKEGRGFPHFVELSIVEDGGKYKISVGQFIGKWLLSPAGSTVTIKPGGRWESVSRDGAFHTEGKWKIEKGAMYWKNSDDPNGTEEINMIMSLGEDRFVLRKPDGSQVEYNRLEYDDRD